MGFLIPAVHGLSSVICDVRRAFEIMARGSHSRRRAPALICYLLFAICHALRPASLIFLRRDESSLNIVKRSPLLLTNV
jgi:hypothetical protein